MAREFTAVCKKAVVGAAAVALVLSGCSSSGTAASSDKKDSLIIGTTNNVVSANPNPVTVGGFLVRQALYNTLVDFDGEGKVQPELAQSWELAPDGRTLTMKLRTDVTFQNGKKFDAAAAAANFAYAQDPKHRVQGGGMIQQVQAKEQGADTLVITMDRPVPQLLSIFVNMPMLDLESKIDTNPVGTGPYKLTSFRSGDQIVMTRNDSYWGDKAKLKEYKVRFFSDPSAAIVALKSGAIDALQAPPSAQAQDLRSAAGIELSVRPGYGNYQYLVNTTKKPFDDPRVRRALSLALNRDAFVQPTNGLSKPTVSMWPSTSVAYTPDNDHPEFNLDKAKALLTEAGVSDLKLDITYSQQAQPEYATFAPKYQADLAKIGVTATLNNVEGTDRNTRMLGGQYTGLITNSYAFANLDPALLFGADGFRPKGNGAQFSDPEYTALIAKAQDETDAAKRVKAYHDIDTFVQSSVFAIQIASAPLVFAVRKDVKDWSINAFGMPLVAGMSK